MGKYFEDEKTFKGYRKVGARVNEIVTVHLELDVIEMFAFYPFFGENFIKCLLRYLSQISEFVKEIYFER